MTVTTLNELLSASSKRFSPSEGGIKPPVEGLPETPPAETPPAETPPTGTPPTGTPPTGTPPAVPTLDQLLAARRNAESDTPKDASEPRGKNEMTSLERFKFNRDKIIAAQTEQRGKLKQFAWNKFIIGLRQFSLQFADVYSKNIDTVTTDPAAAALNYSINNGLIGLMLPEEKEFFQGGGINLMTKEAYKLAGYPIPDDLPSNAWTSAATEMATTGNILSVARRGASLALSKDGIDTARGRAGQIFDKLGRIGRTVNATGDAAKKVGRFVKKTTKEFGEGLEQRPFLTTSVEMAGAAAAGIVGAKFDADFPDEPITKFLAQATAGYGATMALPRRAVEALVSLKDTAVSVSAGVRAERAVQRRLQESVEDNKDDIINKLETKDGQLREEELPELRGKSTNIQQSGSFLLNRISQAIIDQNSKLQYAQQLQLEEYNNALQKAANSIGGTPSYTRQALLEQQAELKRGLDILIENSRLLTLNKIKKILEDGIDLSLEDANRLGQEASEAILKVARQQESDLYLAIPERTLFQLETPHFELQKLLKRRAQNSRPGDIPSYVTKAFGSWTKLTKPQIAALKKKGKPVPPGNRVWTPGNLGKKTNTIELTEIRSRMLEDARLAASVGRKNKARILNKMAESVRHAYSQTPTGASKEAAHKIARANEFSSDLNTAFFNERMAAMFAKTKRGGSKILPEEFLDAALGKKAGRKRAAMIKALHDEPGKFANPGKLRAALENWIKGEFAEKFVKNRQLVDPEGAAHFMDAQRETLEMFPKIAEDLQSVITSGDATRVLVSQSEDLGKRLGNTDISRATMFIESPPKDLFDKIRAIQDIRSNNVGKAIDDFMEEVNTDESGRALSGLQSAFVQYVMDISSSGKQTINSLGLFTDGGRMTLLMNDPAMKVMAFKILTPEQRRTLELIREAATRLDISRNSLPAVEGVLGGEGGPATLLRTFVRVAGAQTGSHISHLTGRGNVQTPGLIASAFEKFLRSKIKDPIAMLINKAFMDDDPTILLAMLKEMKSEEEVRKASLMIGQWFAATVYNSGNAYNEDETEDEQ